MKLIRVSFFVFLVAGFVASVASRGRAQQRPAPNKELIAARNATEKELAAADRQLARLADRIAAKHTELAEHDQSDHVALTRLTQELRDLEDEVAATEARWLELSEVLQ